MKTKILVILSLFLLIVNNSKSLNSSSESKDVLRIDMNKYQTICFDSLVADISCIKLENRVFDTCISMLRYKGYYYFMGRTIAGNGVVIYDTSGKLIKELTFSDALLVNSMCIVPDLEELWVVSRFKIINKFKLDGKPIKGASLPFPCASIMPVNKHNFLVYSGGTCNERGNIKGHFMALTDFKSINKLFMPMWGKGEWPFAPYNMYTMGTNLNNLFIFPDHTDTIYSYESKKESVDPFYFLDFHGDYLKKDKLLDDAEMSEIIKERKYIYSHYSFYQASQKLFFKLKGKREDFCVIDLKDNSLYSFDRLFDYFESRFVNPLIGSFESKLYLLVWEKDIVEHYQNVKCTYPSIRKILPSLSSKGDGWILITIDIKR